MESVLLLLFSFLSLLDTASTHPPTYLVADLPHCDLWHGIHAQLLRNAVAQ